MKIRAKQARNGIRLHATARAATANQARIHPNQSLTAKPTRPNWSLTKRPPAAPKKQGKKETRKESLNGKESQATRGDWYETARIGSQVANRVGAKTDLEKRDEERIGLPAAMAAGSWTRKQSTTSTTSEEGKDETGRSGLLLFGLLRWIGWMCSGGKMNRERWWGSAFALSGIVPLPNYPFALLIYS